MDQREIRGLVSQLADDLAWLEAHGRSSAAAAVLLRLAAAVVRNCIGPFLDGQPALPLHVAVVGGAGAGKSTVANLLSGAAAAETNPQAGFTRHPVAYTSAPGALQWPAHAGFLGPLQRLDDSCPANLDEDVYQVRRLTPDPIADALLRHYVVWDCPDMTTYAATGYVVRLLEVVGLADVIVYVASDERYNDEIPTQFLKLMLEAGKPVIACLVKMKEADVPTLLAHFTDEVASRLPAGLVATVAIPHLSPEQLADPARHAARYRIPLVNQLSVLADPPHETRWRVVQAGIRFLREANDQLLTIVRDDLAALETWRSLVENGQAEFENRYRREYLMTSQFHRFDEALVRLLELLELPGIGRYVSETLRILRKPYHLLRDFLSRALSRPEAPSLPEQPVLEGALAGWLDMLQAEAARRADGHPFWAHIEAGFHSGLARQAKERFQEGFRAFQLSLADEVERTARALYEDLEKNPAVLNTLRGTKFSLEAASIAAVVAAGGLNWTDVILVPLAASITHQLVEWLGQQYVDAQREAARNRQQALVSEHVARPLAEWLIRWPATGGSDYERLQLALRRIPTAVDQLAGAVADARAGQRA
ncbi:MAG: GTPase domain-containing protein [Gemmataceae bacterium]|nr:GTPase domain-containing protein [Gemmataceae bacterium]MDW8264036.1 GTPase domain-containing protein [Gemmataceae bacterium]